MFKGKVAIIGDKDCVFAFRSVGIDVFSPIEKEQIEEQIRKLSKDDYVVILITEDKAELISEYIIECKSKVFPIILPIPNGSGSTGWAMGGIKHNIEKAIGREIVFNKEDENDAG